MDNSDVLITTKFRLDLDPMRIIITDTIDYAGEGEDPNDFKGVLRIDGPAGVFYENTDFNDPDIDPGVSRESTKQINLPTDPANDNWVLKGQYTVKYTIQKTSTLDEYFQTFVYGFSFDAPTMDVDVDSGPYSAQLRSVDNTNYGSDVDLLSREHRIQYPTELALPDIVTTQDSYTVDPIYTKLWTVIVTTTVDYKQAGDDLEYRWIGTETVEHCVAGSCITSFYDAIDEMFTYYLSIYGTSPNEADRYSRSLDKINTAWQLLDIAWMNNDVEEADKHSAYIQEELEAFGYLVCPTGTSTQVSACPAWGGGGSPPSYTFENGLTETAGTVKLGGTITEDTTLTLGANGIEFVGVSGGDNVLLDVDADDGLLMKGSDTSYEKHVLVKKDELSLKHVDVGTPANNKTYNVAGNGMVEAADYSGDYTDRSLIAKGFADTSYLSTANGTINALADKASPVGADVIIIEDSAASYAQRKATLSNILGVSSFLDLSDTPSSYTGHGGKMVRVNATPDGLEFYDYTGDFISTANGTVQGLSYKGSPVSADVLLLEDSAASYEQKYTTVGDLPSGTSSFTGLTDTPGSYSGEADKVLMVNSTPDAVIFVTPPWVDSGGGTFTGAVTIQGTANTLLKLQQTDSGGTPGTPEAGQNYIEFLDSDGDIQGYLGINAAGEMYLKPNVSGQDIYLDAPDITVAGTVDGVDIAAFKTAYDSHTHTFASLTSKPTTISGYGITDAMLNTANSWTTEFSSKASAVSGDYLVIEDSADSYNKKYVQVGNLPTSATTFLSLTDTPGTFAGSGLYILRVNSGATAVQFYDMSGDFISTANGTLNALSQKVTPVGADVLLIEDSAASYSQKKVLWSQLPGGGGTFLGNSDTPSSYAGSADYLVMVNSTPDALVFVDPSGYNLSNFNDDLSGNKHIDHSGVDIATSATSGLTGGGDITTTRNLALDFTQLTNETTLADADEFAYYDSGAGMRALLYSALKTALNNDLSFSSVDEFTDLTDTPANYTGHGDKFVRVNSTPDALEFVAASSINLSDFNDDLSGNKYVDHSGVSISTQHSLTGGGDITTTRTLNLVNDVASPGNNKYYGTNGVGTRGWYDLGGDSDELVKVSSNDTTAGYFEDKFVVSHGTNSTNPLELSTLNDGLDEDRQLQFDESKVDHDNLLNTHNLTTDIDHDTITNTHNLTTDIDHDTITNTHNLTTDIDHNTLTNYDSNEHIDHTGVSIATSSTSGLTGGGTIAATRNIALDFTQLTNETALADTDEFAYYDTGVGMRALTYSALKTALNSDLSFSTVDEFTDLTDTPANYTAHGDKFVRVNSTPDALEFVAASSINLSDFNDDLSYENPLTITNGLTRSVDTVKLGGTLTEATTITGTSTNTILFQQANGAVDSAQIGIHQDNAIDIIVFANNDYSGDETAIYMDEGTLDLRVQSSTNESRIAMSTSAMTVTDTINTKGLVYAGDYSTNFTARSLVDQGYVSGNFLATADGTIQGLTYKNTPVSGDVLLIEDSAASYNQKYTTIGDLPGGGTTFTGLTDTPGSYTGHAGKVLRVNSTPDAVEFVTVADLMADLTAGEGIKYDSGTTYDGSTARTMSLDITNLSSEATPAAADELVLWDGSNHKKFTWSQLPGTSYTFDSGISESGGNVDLGGTLTANAEFTGNYTFGVGTTVTTVGTFNVYADSIRIGGEDGDNYLSVDGTTGTTFNGNILTNNTASIGTSGSFWGSAFIEQVYFTDTNTTIGKDGSNNLILTDINTTGWRTLTQLRTFTGMDDTPANYTGHGDKFVRVNSTPDALEFVAASSINLSDFNDDLSYENPLTFSNGLTRTVDAVTLGGTLTGATTITGTDTNTIIIQGASSTDSFQISSYQDASIDLKVFANTNYTGDESQVSVSEGDVILAVYSGGNDSYIDISTASMEIKDLINTKGLIYAADYSGNFTARSLVDKGYVDGLTYMSDLTDTTNGGLADFTYDGSGAVSIGLDFTNLTNETALAAADEFAFYDSGVGMRAITYTALQTALNNDLSFMSDLIDDQTPQLYADLDMNQNSLEFDPTPTTDDTGQGVVVTMTIDTGQTVEAGEPLYINSTDGELESCDASAGTTMPCVALAMGTGTGSQKVLLLGILRNDNWNWTAGDIVYVSETTGTLTQTVPTTSGAFVQVVGVALSADVLWFNPDFTMVEIA